MLAVKQVNGKFNSTGCDSAREQSQNRSAAATGLLIGIKQNKNAIQRWLLVYNLKNLFTLLFYHTFKCILTLPVLTSIANAVKVEFQKRTYSNNNQE